MSTKLRPEARTKRTPLKPAVKARPATTDPSSDDVRALTRVLAAFARGDWLVDSPGLPREVRRLMPALLVSLLNDAHMHKKTTKGEACQYMAASAASAGPKYLEFAEQAGLIHIEANVPGDARKHFVALTPVGQNLVRLHLKAIADKAAFAQQVSATILREYQE